MKETVKPREPIPPHLPLALFIDDEDGFAEAWQEVFRTPDVVSLRAFIPDQLSEITRQSATDGITAFMESFSDAELSRVALIIIDQFYDSGQLRDQACAFIAKVRQHNPNVAIYESSGAPQEQVYPGSIRSFWCSSVVDIRPHLRRTPPIFARRLQTLAIYSEPAFIEATKMDRAENPLSADSAESDYRRAAYSFRKLTESGGVEQLSQATRLSKEQLYQISTSLTLPQLYLFLHTAWTIVGHIRLGNDDRFYGMSLSRLLSLLEDKLNP